MENVNDQTVDLAAEENSNDEGSVSDIEEEEEEEPHHFFHHQETPKVQTPPMKRMSMSMPSYRHPASINELIIDDALLHKLTEIINSFPSPPTPSPNPQVLQKQSSSSWGSLLNWAVHRSVSNGDIQS